MSIYDQDTDPSSPDARRQATPEPAMTTSPRSATTDPGVGPPSVPGTVRAMGVVVPAGTPQPPSVASRGVPVTTPSPGRTAPKDSVELLLEGMGGPRPDRTKTTPQTGGEASAAYHAEHSLRAGHSGHDEDMKVLVDTVRLPAAADSNEQALRYSGDPTFILQSRLGPRIVVAALAGLLVVAAIFTFFSWSSGLKSATSAPAPAAEEALARAAVAAPDLPKAAAVPMPVIPATAEPAAAPQPVAEAPAAPAVVEAPLPSLAPAPAAVASRTKTTDHARKSPSDVGEFKTTF